MKIGLLWVTLSLFCIPCFSRLLTWIPVFTIENTTPLEITTNGSKRNGMLNFYKPGKVRQVFAGLPIVRMISLQEQKRNSTLIFYTLFI